MLGIEDPCNAGEYDPAAIRKEFWYEESEGVWGQFHAKYTSIGTGTVINEVTVAVDENWYNTYGPGRELCAGRGGQDRGDGQDFHEDRGIGFPYKGAEHVYGGDG